MEFEIYRGLLPDHYEVISTKPVSSVPDEVLGYELFYYLTIEVNLSMQTKIPKLLLCRQEEIAEKPKVSSFEEDTVIRFFRRRKHIESLLEDLYVQVKHRIEG